MTETVVNLSEEEGFMIALEELTRSRVGEILEAQYGAVTRDDDGGLWVVLEGMALRAILVRAGQYVVLRISAFAITKVPRSAELYRWVAEDDASFGHIRIVDRDDDDHADLVAFHDLLGNYLDYDELVVAITGVALVARSAANEVMERFGGDATRGPTPTPEWP